MPFLLVIGAAYACYSKNGDDKAKKGSQIDPKIQLRGKSVLDLHSFEKEMSMMELPISVVSFFEGNYKEAAQLLERRVEEILRLNPWLGGILLPMPDVKIVYDRTGKDRPPGILTAYEPGSIALKKDTPYGSYFHVLNAAMVCGNESLIGQNKPIWKVALIPDAAEPDSKFAMLVSMSHAVGDAHTFYKVYNMLSVEQQAEALNAHRASNYMDSVVHSLGATEVNFVHDLISGKFHSQPADSAVDQNVSQNITDVTENSALDTSLRSTGDSTASSIEELEQALNESQSPLINSFIQHQKETHSKYNVMKMFYVSEEWIVEQRENVLMELDSNISVSTNSIISSWFTRINESAVGIIMMNLRHRLPDCTISDLHAGNFAHAVVGKEDDFATPQNVQRLTQRMGRVKDLPVGSTESTASVATPALGNQELQFCPERNASICTNWTNFYRDELSLMESCRATVHIPIYDTTTLQYLPDKVSAINLFTARCGSGPMRRRTGAFVVCQETVWKQIEESGFVAEMILDV
jgi:hypothetical protein